MRKVLSKLDKPLLVISILMFCIGLFSIFSASYVKASFTNSNAFHYLFRQSVILFICLFVFIIVINTSTNLYKKYIKLAMYSIIALLGLLFIIGKTVNGASSWFDLGMFDLQPSELSKILLIIFMGVYYDKYKDTDKLKVVIKPLIFIVAILALVFLQPDLGTVIITLIITASIFICLPINKKVKKRIYMMIVGAVVLLASIFSYFYFIEKKPLIQDYQLLRFNILNPCKRYTEPGTGYQVCNGYIAINNGGLTGVGIGNSTQKYLYLPEAHTDFIFPIIIEEDGLITGIVIFLLYFIIIYRIYMISRRSSTLMGSIICHGVACFIAAHIIVNLGGVFGLLPLTGVPLPFLSYGGTFALVITISLGVVQRICYESKISEQSRTLQHNIKEK